MEFASAGKSPNPDTREAENAISDVAVRAELDAILESSYLRDSELLKRFLRYVVERTLDGQGRQLKEYRLGTEVFGKDQSFDPRLDPIVRMAAGRLRGKLRDYYQNGGLNHPLRIEIPKGGYAANFVVADLRTAEDELASKPADRTPRVASLRLSWNRRSATLGVTLVAALVAGGLYYRARETNRLGARRLSATDTIVLADFVNTTGDAVFDDTLKTALGFSLQQSPFLNVLAEPKIASTLKMMTLPAGTKLTPDVARELCQRAGSKAYISGAIASLGSKYVLQLKAVSCQDGEMVAQEQVTANAKENVLDELGEAASRLRSELGESLAMVQKYDVPLVAATTSSLEALKVFSLGQKVYRERGPEASLPYDLQAFAIDPDFALAYFQAGSDYHSLYQVARARMCIARAFELRERTSEREKLAIEAYYYRNVTGELEKAVQTDQEEIESYPREQYGYIRLGVDYATLGQWEKARDATVQAMRLVSDSVAVGNLASMELALQNFDRVQQLIQQATDRKVDNLQFHTALYAISFLGGNSSGMEQEKRWFAGTSDEAIGLALASDTESYAGRVLKADKIAGRALKSAIRTDSKETGAVWQENNALRDAAYGFAKKARTEAEAGLKLAPDSVGVQVEAGLAFAMSRDSARAEKMVQSLNQNFPADTQVQSLWLPTIRAQLALNRNDGAGALETLQAASAKELGLTPFVNNLSCLNSAYLRGEAELQTGQGAAAAAEFQKILDHGGLVWNCWTGALAQLGIARAHALEAKTQKGNDANALRARCLAAYKNFLTLWDDADANVPIYQEAQSEYTRYRQNFLGDKKL